MDEWTTPSIYLSLRSRPTVSQVVKRAAALTVKRVSGPLELVKPPK